MIKRILTIQDFSSVGRCSLTAAIPIISALGHEVVGLPTVVLSSQSALDNHTFVDLSSNIEPSFKQWQKLNLKFDCLYTGYLGNISAIEETIKIVKVLKKQKTKIIVDPVMGDNDKLYSSFDQDYVEKMKELAKLADILLPNFTEAKFLTDLKMPLVHNKENANMLLNIFGTNDYRTVILSGVKEGNTCGTATYDEGLVSFQMNEGFDNDFHGAGDVFASVFAGEIVRGKSVILSAQSGVDFVCECIKNTLKDKADLAYGLHFEKLLPKLAKKK